MIRAPPVGVGVEAVVGLGFRVEGWGFPMYSDHGRGGGGGGGSTVVVGWLAAVWGWTCDRWWSGPWIFVRKGAVKGTDIWLSMSGWCGNRRSGWTKKGRMGPVSRPRPHTSCPLPYPPPPPEPLTRACGHSMSLFHTRGAGDCTNLDGGSEVHLQLSLSLSLSLTHTHAHTHTHVRAHFGGRWVERPTVRVVVEALVGLGFKIAGMGVSNVLRP
jgi:hypothetical protein